jgi:transglutaminase-like putative cysteine protease
VTLNGRMTVTTAVACVLASTALMPLFRDTLWLAIAAGAVIAVAATGALTRLRTRPVAACLAASVAGLLLYLNLVFEARHSLLFVIPTPASINRLFELVDIGVNYSRHQQPPVPNLPALLLLAAGGVGITALLADLIAVRLRCAALAGLPLLALFTAPVVISASHDRVTTCLAFCLGGAGYLAMLGAERRERTRVWGLLISRCGTGPGPDTRALATAGRRVGLASIVLALCAPLLVPGLHASRLFFSGADTRSLPGSIAQTVGQLHEGDPHVVFTYTTTASASLESNDAQYFSQYVFDTLSDTGWQARYAGGAAPISSVPAPQGLSDLSSSQSVETTVTVSRDFPGPGAEPAFLPLPYPATGVDAPGKWLADPDLMVYSTSNSIAGRTYSIKSLVVDPSQAQLGAVPRLTNPADLAPDLGLPPSYETKALKNLAETIVGAHSTEFGEVNALANWLSGPHFSYNLAAVPFEDAAGLLSFLTKVRSGFCVEYAWAMTVLTRLLGIPARFVTGYTAGTRLANGSYQVKNTDAHAWTEVYFPTLGWIRFEPTPGGAGTANAPNYMSSSMRLGPSAGIINPVTGAPAAPADQPPVSSASTHQSSPSRPSAPAAGSPTEPGALPTGSAGTPWAALALAVIAAIALACGIIAIVASPSRRQPSGNHTDTLRRRRRLTATSGTLIIAAALATLTLYRLLSHTSSPDPRAIWATAGMTFAAASVLTLITPAAARVALRRWHWMRATDNASRAHVAWREFHDDLADYGVGARPSESPRALASRVTAGMPEPVSAAIGRLALAEERARYSTRTSGSQLLRRDSAAARRGLAARARRSARWRARVFPVSVTTALADATAHIAVHAAALTRRREAGAKSLERVTPRTSPVTVIIRWHAHGR